MLFTGVSACTFYCPENVQAGTVNHFTAIMLLETDQQKCKI